MPANLPLGLSSACLEDGLETDLLPIIAAAGLTHLELYPQGLPALQDPGAIARIGEQARAAGLVTWSLHAPFGPAYDPALAAEKARREAVGALTAACDQAAAFGAALVIVHAGCHDPGAGDREASLIRAVRSCNELVKRASQRGLRLALEYLPPGPRNLGNTARELLWLQHMIDGEIGFCADINHMNLGAQTLPEALGQLASALWTTHLSDNDGVREQHWLPGSGVIDWAEVRRSLDAAAYTGPLLLEAGNFAADTPAARIGALARAAAAVGARASCS